MKHKLGDIVITTASFYQMEGTVCKVVDVKPLGYVRGKVITCEDSDGKRYTAGHGDFITPKEVKENKYNLYRYMDWSHEWLQGICEEVRCCDNVDYKSFKFCPECGGEL